MTMTGNLLETVLENTYSVSSARQRIAILKEFFEGAFFGEPMKQPTVESFMAYAKEKDIEDAQAQAIAAWGGKIFATVTSGTLYTQLNALLAALAEVPVLTLYTPVKFPLQQLSELGARIRSLVGKQLLVDDHVEPTLFVGCGFVWNGIYHEYGFPFFTNRKRDELARLITRYESHEK